MTSLVSAQRARREAPGRFALAGVVPAAFRMTVMALDRTDESLALPSVLTHECGPQTTCLRLGVRFTLRRAENR